MATAYPSGMRTCLLPALALALVACRGEADDRLTPTKLPGFEVALPSWDTMARGDRWMADRVALADEGHERLVNLQWSPSTALWTPRELTAALEASRTAFDAGGTLGDPIAEKISGHEGYTLPMTIESISGHVTTWFCPEHKRQFILFTLAPEAVHRAMVASVRCHTEAPPAGAVDDRTLFPKFDPPPKFTRTTDEDPSMQTWSSDDAVVELMAGTPGDALATLEGEAMRPTIQKMLDLGGLSEVGAITDSEVTDAAGLTRHLYRTAAKVEGTALDVTLAIWFCASIDRSFIAIHASAAGLLTSYTAEQHLLRATCP